MKGSGFGPWAATTKAIWRQSQADGIEVANDGPRAISRAEWALSRIAHGEGALHGKFKHPSVAPYLRALQRQLPQIEALLA